MHCLMHRKLTAHEAIAATVQKHAYGPYLYAASAEYITADPPSDIDFALTSPTLPQGDRQGSPPDERAHVRSIIGHITLEAPEHRRLAGRILPFPFPLEQTAHQSQFGTSD
jgi:hypothetical protein